MRFRPLTAMLLACTAVLGMSVASASAHALPKPVAKVIYNSTPSPAPGSLPSLGVEAYSFSQLGDEVQFGRHGHTLDKVTVGFTDWACQSGQWNLTTCVTDPGATFKVPVTLNIYRWKATQPSGDTMPGPPVDVGDPHVLDAVSPVNERQVRGYGIDGSVVRRGREGMPQRALPHRHLQPAGAEAEASPADRVRRLVQLRQPRPQPARWHQRPRGFAEPGAQPRHDQGQAGVPRRDVLGYRLPRVHLRGCHQRHRSASGFVPGVFNLDGPCNGTPNTHAGYVPAVKITALP